MSKTLELIFKSNLNKPVKLLLPDFNAITTEQLIKESMNQLLELDILRFSLGKPVKIYAAQLISILCLWLNHFRNMIMNGMIIILN